jgi:antitoxin MazE
MYLLVDPDAKMKTRLVRIGNSRGVRIPKPLIEQAGLGEEVELRVVQSGLMVETARTPRSDWAEAARQLHERGEDGLLDESCPTQFDKTEWEWR